MSYILSAFADEASPDFTEQMRICRENGVRYIEVRGVDGKNVSDLSKAEVAELAQKLKDGGFGVSSIGSPFGKIGINDDFDAHLDKFKRTIETARMLGTKYMRIFSFYMPKGEDADAYEDKVFSRLNEFVKYADGIMLCHENESGIFGDAPRRCKRIYDHFGGKIRIIHDPANYVVSGYDPREAYALLKDHIEYFHIKDAVCGTGQIVPSGYGDGGIENALIDFYAKSNKTFLTVEPHLKVFKGLEHLQNEELAHSNRFVYESNEEAFGAAVMALKTILCANSFALEKNLAETPEGEIWIKR
ncbi:MAG: sugar phosphate isomerase/epimerase [Defluviitaleaceae bacterium]|nr:sugar phosphate isomerase/epimerase [Defluviitaleaceae bacterium]